MVMGHNIKTVSIIIPTKNEEKYRHLALIRFNA